MSAVLVGSSVSELEAGLGFGAGFKAKAGFQSLHGKEPSANIPFKLIDTFGAGQADGTGAVSTKFSAEVAIPFLTVTAAEVRAGVQSPLNGVPVTDKNFGGLAEAKFLEPKVSPLINFGLNFKWDVFNTSYKLNSSEK